MYNRELLNDTTALIVLSDTVHENALLVGKLTYLNRQPTKIYNNTFNTITNPSINQFYIGTTFGGNTNNYIIGGNMMLKTKNNALYVFNVEYMPMLSKKPMFTLSRMFKIKL